MSYQLNELTVNSDRQVLNIPAGTSTISHPLNEIPNVIEFRNDMTGAIIEARTFNETASTFDVFFTIGINNVRVTIS